eukprot:499117-Pelagomonas_calceolata.AAC.1
MGIREVTSSSPRLVLMMTVGRNLLKSASGASKFISVLDRMSMKLQIKLSGFMNVKTKLFQRPQDEVTGGLKCEAVSITRPRPGGG